MSEYDGSRHSLNGNENIRIFYEKNSRMKFYFGNENQMLEVIFVNALQKLYINTLASLTALSFLKVFTRKLLICFQISQSNCNPAQNVCY